MAFPSTWAIKLSCQAARKTWWVEFQARHTNSTDMPARLPMSPLSAAKESTSKIHKLFRELKIDQRQICAFIGASGHGEVFGLC